ncbi:unnamed protein product [Allacma fusca]|uniref:Uncharacterized protein n=1 Tax=Allacma fusca TaxID=39272 RepID=A0A8J2KN73_9HEXA|nr:unnamed protein product [Allacma fusca]
MGNNCSTIVRLRKWQLMLWGALVLQAICYEKIMLTMSKRRERRMDQAIDPGMTPITIFSSYLQRRVKEGLGQLEGR